MAEVKWIKIATDIFDDEKILLIESLPEADAIIVIWFKLLTLAGKKNNSGVFLINDRIPYTDEMFSTIFRRPVNIVRLALETFRRFGMIDVIEDTVTIPNWEKHQSLDQIEKHREYMKNYMAERRDKQRRLIAEGKSDSKVNCKTNSKTNVSDADKNRLDKNRLDKTDIYINLPADLVEALHEFEKMRKMIKAPMTDEAKKRLLSKLDKLAGDDTKKKIEILQRSIDHDWKGVYPLEGDTRSTKDSDTEELPEGWEKIFGS